jgi:hypothetical protein
VRLEITAPTIKRSLANVVPYGERLHRTRTRKLCAAQRSNFHNLSLSGHPACRSKLEGSFTEVNGTDWNPACIRCAQIEAGDRLVVGNHSSHCCLRARLPAALVVAPQIAKLAASPTVSESQ